MNINGSKFVPGPYPKQRTTDPTNGAKWPSGSLAPSSGPDAIYSGLLECPITTRIKKQVSGGGWNDTFTANIRCPTCPKIALKTADACFAAGKQNGLDSGVSVKTSEGASDLLPSGCSVAVGGSSGASI